MKKMTQKLALSRETLRTLETSTLGQVAAGDTTTVIASRYPSCQTYCDLTMGC